MASTILIVEDEWLIAEDHAETLRDAHYRVLGPCASVNEALTAIENVQVDAACLDVELSHEHSYPVADRLQQLGVPLIFLSGHDQCVLPVRLRHCPVLSKPVDPKVLLAAVAGMVQAG